LHRRFGWQRAHVENLTLVCGNKGKERGEEFLMNEYTFLTSQSWRSEHVKARTMREAWRIAKKQHAALSVEERERYGSLIPHYQSAREGDMVMSGWIPSLDKSLT